MFDFGIVGYEPRWLHGLEAVVAAHGRRLGALAGRVLQHVWLVWDLDAHEWFPDCPVLLDLGDDHVLVNHQKLDDLSITFGRVDVSRPLTWGTSDGFRLSWRAEPLPELGALAGQTVQGTELREFSGDFPATGSVAVSLRFAAGRLRIFNACDENGLAFDPPGSVERGRGATWRSAGEGGGDLGAGGDAEFAQDAGDVHGCGLR